MVKGLSVYDPGTVLKDVHDEAGHALRIRDANSRVPSEYSRVIFEKDPSTQSITKATFYRGTQAEKTRIKFIGDVGGSLSGKYFFINTAEDDTQYYVWYNDGFATDPSIVGRVGVEIPYVQNDPSSLICRATYLYFFNTSECFTTETNGDDVLLIENIINGATTNSSDVNTGFGITTIHEGITKRICTLSLPTDPGIRYFFNEAERKFELVADQIIAIPGLTVSTPGIINFPIVSANTEYNITLNVNIRKYEFQLRGMGKLQYCFSSGQSNTNFFTVYPGNKECESGLALIAPLTIYFRSSKAGETLEIKTFE